MKSKDQIIKKEKVPKYPYAEKNCIICKSTFTPPQFHPHTKRCEKCRKIKSAPLPAIIINECIICHKKFQVSKINASYTHLCKDCLHRLKTKKIKDLRLDELPPLNGDTTKQILEDDKLKP